jgi:hypothetical protein
MYYTTGRYRSRKRGGKHGFLRRYQILSSHPQRVGVDAMGSKGKDAQRSYNMYGKPQMHDYDALTNPAVQPRVPSVSTFFPHGNVSIATAENRIPGAVHQGVSVTAIFRYVMI